MRLYPLMLAPAAALAAIAAPAHAQMQPSDATYETKLKCGAFNAFMSGFNGEDTEEGQEATNRAEMWVDLAMEQKSDQMDQVVTDFENTANALTEQVEAQLTNEDVTSVFAIFNEYQALCDPYGG